jgi:hypothetical protein
MPWTFGLEVGWVKEPFFLPVFYFIFIFLRDREGLVDCCTWQMIGRFKENGWFKLCRNPRQKTVVFTVLGSCESYHLWQIDDLFYIIVCCVLRIASLLVLWWMHHLIFRAVLLSNFDFGWFRHSPWISTWDLTWKHIHKKTIISVHTQNVERDMLMNTSWRTTLVLIMKR